MDSATPKLKDLVSSVSNHRAVKGDVRAQDTSSADVSGPSPSAPGKRRATRHSRGHSRATTRGVLTPDLGIHASRSHLGGRKRLIPGLPSAAGVAALALAAAGAVTVSQPVAAPQLSAGGLQQLSAQASVLNGASDISSNSAATVRERSLSRDSQRTALADAADEKLLAAAEAQAKERNAALLALRDSAEKQAGIIAQNAWQLPFSGGGYRLTGRFGEASSLWANTHTGLDFAIADGTPIEAVAGGVVTEAGWAGSYGYRVIVTLQDGTELWYCHQSAVAVSAGETVNAGDVIGYVGATGNVTGPHLHLEVRPGAGDPVDPYNALVARGLQP